MNSRPSIAERTASLIGRIAGSCARGYRVSSQIGNWEGAEFNRLRNRPRSVRISEDATLDYGRREDLMSEARSLCNTTGIPNRVLRQYANYVVGDCQPRWSTSDPAWDELAEEGFYNWSRHCDLRNANTLQEKAAKHMMGMIRDGDSFAVKLFLEDEPKLQDVEADRVANYRGGVINVDEDTNVGGVEIDGYGRPEAYHIWDRTRFGQFQNLQVRPASAVLHIYDSTRFDAIRGVTHFHSVLNHQRDLTETINAQKAKQKLMSKLALLVRNGMGGPNAGNIDILGNDTNEKGANIKTEAMGDGAIKYKFNGDEMQPFLANDPSDGWFRLTVHLVREIAIGVDLPFEFIWDMAGLAGPGIRMMSKQAQRTFRAKQDILETRLLNPVCAWWVNYEMQPGRSLPFNAEWPSFRFQRPAHLSIDFGRDSAANLSELGNGVSTEARIAQEQGEDDEEVAETRMKEVRRKLVNAQTLVGEFPDVTLSEALDLIGRPNVPKTAVAPADVASAEDAKPSKSPAKTSPRSITMQRINGRVAGTITGKTIRKVVMERDASGKLFGVLTEENP